ncbi:BLOC-1-related complex subunit 7-like [Haliotis cracherodii]|uniref:BLOC-1-related complex subunit 7-like n=1 Tax=Haliotis cracherodii TaxID=6455 RepID=UPI0039EC9EF7
MASASWNHETKARLNEKISANINDLGSLARQVIRGSKSNDLLAQAAKNFSSQEPCINHSFDTLKKLDHIKSQLEFQQAAIERSMGNLDEIQDELKTIRR